MKKHNAGYSLIETLVAIVVLGLIVVPTCTGMVMSFRINAKTEELMQAQLAVSSAVETLMAEGINNTSIGEVESMYSVEVTPESVAEGDPAVSYDVTVVKTDADGDVLVSVTTHIRAKGGT